MSHITGTVQFLNPLVTIGPDSGDPPDAQNLWVRELEWTEPADPTGAKLLVLHFTDAVLPAQNRLEVDLGYGMDVFTAADGSEFWTRPVNPNDFPDGVPIRYITDGAPNGRARLDRYGRGERHPGHQDPNALSNSDPFLPASPYPEPVYDPFWVCSKNAPPKWENVRCVAAANDLRRRVARSVGMIVTIHHGHPGDPDEVAFDHVSTCSVTLVGADLVLTAGHCITPEEAAAASVTFDYEVACDGTRLPGYAPVFHKVKKVIAHAWNGSSGPDYALLQIDIPAGGLGLPVIEMRGDLPPLGEPVFCIHHPNGAVKKLSPKQPATAAVTFSADTGIGVNLDVSGGSSGSGLFDAAGRVVGVLSSSGACSLGYWPTKRVLEDVATPPGPPASREVVIVFDRSGSMSLPAGTGRTRIEEARDAASLFVQLVRAGGGNRVGLVSFSSTASNPVDFALADVTAASKTALVGPVPFVTGKVGALAPGGNTSIGAGVDRARQELPAAGARSILLLTDGLQNTAPTLQSVEPQLGSITVDAIGFGTEASLDGALLSAVAQAHGGVYTRAGDPLDLKKFFALAFGNIFEDGVLLDPPAVLPRGEEAAKPLPFQVCGEETVTVVVGWDRADGVLGVRVRTPGGVVLDGASPGVEAVRGLTWAFLRVPLPAGGERDGTWRAEVRRESTGGGELPSTPVELRYFVQVIPRGGPRLLPKPDPRRYYTGDRYNPLVGLLYPDGTYPRGAKVRVTVSRPDAGVGAILSQAKLGPPSAQGGDAVPALQATLMELEAASQGPLVGYDQSTFELFDRREHDNGAFVPDGVFGTPLEDFLTVEGSYTFHFRATYGEGCTGTRELVRSLHVEVGVDPGRTEVRWVATGTAPGGGRRGVITFIPRDRYGNPLGPGRGDGLEVAGAPGTTVTGPVHDHGDGSYGVSATWDGRGAAPAVSIGQPGRDPVVVGSGLDAAAAPGGRSGCWGWMFLLLFLALLWNLLR